MRVFVDTSALYALLDRDDANHEKAAATWPHLLDRDVAMLTSNYVVIETTALVQHRLGMTAVASLVRDVLPVVDTEWVTPDDHRTAMAALLGGGRRKVSLVDHVSFTIMRRLGIERAWAFDPHFAQEGLASPGGSERA